MTNITMQPLHCGLRGAKTGTKMPYDDFFLEVKYISYLISHQQILGSSFLYSKVDFFHRFSINIQIKILSFLKNSLF